MVCHNYCLFLSCQCLVSNFLNFGSIVVNSQKIRKCGLPNDICKYIEHFLFLIKIWLLTAKQGDKRIGSFPLFVDLK